MNVSVDIWYKIVEWIFPFDWAHYAFMKNALLAVLLAAPLFALLGTMVVSHRMVFFSDVLGHSALTGIALGVIFGISDPSMAMVIFMVVLALSINFLKRITAANYDTVLGVFFASVVALGIVILSRGGGFAKFTPYLIGDILSVTPGEIRNLALIFAFVLLYWLVFGNKLILMSVNPILIYRRGISAFLIENSFTVLLAVVVAFSIKLVGILIINSLLILPAAAARNISNNVRRYTLWSLILSLISCVLGLLTSYYLGTAAGATMVLFAAAFYGVSVTAGFLKRKVRKK